ncbi:hypothetical protein [Lysinibacillus sphaericus]|uniref:hypothetical protein n=1 Tax=Lysinibacillus sphaericus TaxID=1421 RepID=UPI0018CD7C49|nr:hypothetical protein [Lysinibacillus sphaericus]MBG9479397.1 hypothetical protein [Lysinibacillus sphaericus]MBG9479447.1 hypothetical protein [Lysinibacillus sphaericus]
MKKPKFYNGRPIIQPGEVYEIDGIDYKVITGTSEIINDNQDVVGMTELVWWLENVETKERSYMRKSELESKFKDI